MTSAVEVRELVRSFSGKNVLKGVNLDLALGETLGFLGPNGAGKTTVMRILMGLLAADSGTVRVLGQDPCTGNNQLFSRIGYLPENPPLHKEMRVGEFMDYAASIRMPRIWGQARSRAIESALEKCGLREVRGQVIGTLSKGFRQRVGLAQAIIHEPELIIMDEPTGGLDPLQMAAMRESVMAVREGASIMFSSHDLHLASRVCHRFAIIHRGLVTVQGDRDELLRVSGSSGSSFVRIAFPAIPTADHETWMNNLTTELTDLAGGQAASGSSEDALRIQRDGQVVEITADSSLGGTACLVRHLVTLGLDVLEAGRREPHLEELFLDISNQESARTGEESHE